ncbi:hypothetical protein AN958_11819 [Leucoagaricus sp. SymC.cos]|nr:hypothetical protein AN958_11819 [Leucoagaricus sp. SymC.cos]
MPPMLTDEDLSLRHLPEVSNYSFSFQIPTSSLPKGDDLMAEDNTFFEGLHANSTLATPVPSARTKARIPARPLQAFTPRLSTLESSPTSQQSRTSPHSESPSTSYGHAELQPSPITQAPISSKQLGSLEVEAPDEEERKQEHQDQEATRGQDPCMSASTTSSLTLNSILLPLPKFAERSSLGSQPEAGHSGLDLPQTESLSQGESATMDEEKNGQLEDAYPKESRRSRLGSKTGRSVSTGNPRSFAEDKPPSQVSLFRLSICQLTDGTL